jgi:SAM-dependent methyltransferase
VKRLIRATPFGSRRGTKWRKRSDPVRGRRRALKEEVGYWADWLSTKGGKWAEDYAFRFDPAAEVEDPALREALTALPQREVSILDVGAGPASAVGCRFPGKDLVVVAVDPLADSYNRLLAKSDVDPPVRTEALEGERLAQRFGPDRFEIAYSRNALDHAVDPVLIVEQMLAVVRPGGYVVLRHGRNEAVDEEYVQLHQWNFDERDGQLVIWRPGQETNVTEAFAGLAEVTCRIEGGWIVCVLAKRESSAT